MRASEKNISPPSSDLSPAPFGDLNPQDTRIRGAFLAAKDPASGCSAKPLSNREEEILEYVARGLINKEIAGLLCIDLETVRSHLKNIYLKLNAHSRTEAAVKYFLELGSLVGKP